MTPRGRLANRAAWCQGALAATVDADLVFLDPDNGLAGTSARRGGRAGGKYVFLDELSPYLERNQGVVVYHHQGRHGSVEEQVGRWLDVLLALPGVTTGWGMTYHRQQVRAYFVLATQQQSMLLRERTSRFLSGPWGAQFRWAGASKPEATALS